MLIVTGVRTSRLTSQPVPEGKTRETLGMRRKAVKGNWRKLHEESVHTSYSSAIMD
jgi:hypothetical protein